jgi:hypothetical protein
LKKALEDLAELMSEKEELAQRCHELDVQVHTYTNPLSTGPLTDALNKLAANSQLNEFHQGYWSGY